MRAERRHHERRIKAKFRRIVRRWWWRTGGTESELTERIAVRKAHHPKCPCRLCKRKRYDRKRPPA